VPNRAPRHLPLSLLLGFFITLATCWLLPGLFRGHLHIHWTTGVDPGGSPPESTGVRWAHTTLVDYISIEPIKPTGPYFNGYATPPAWAHTPPAWSGIDRADSESVGFPFRALVGHTTYALAPTRGHFDVLTTRGSLILSRTSDRFNALPYLPRWPGLLADIAIWSTTAHLTLTTIAHLRARRKHKLKGLCPTCHYNRAGLPPSAPCPECGTPPASPAPAGEVPEALRGRRG
jgi:hypothetical protein